MTMINPSLVPPGQSASPVAGVPLLQSLGAGAVQGARDIGLTLGRGEQAAARVAPFLPDLSGPVGALQAQTDAYNRQYGGDWKAALGRLGSEILLTAPITGPIGGAARGVAAAMPVAGRLLAPAVEGAIAGGGTNALVSGGTGENPLTAAATGAVGGAAVGGALGAVGSAFGGGAAGSRLHDIADRLGISLSAGQKAGPGSVAARVEDTSAIVPGSGAAPFAAQQRQQITQAIAREAGIAGPVQTIDTPMLNEAENRIGGDIENAAKRITVPGGEFLNSVAPVEQFAMQAGSASPQASVFRDLSNQMLNLMANNGGDLPGTAFQRFIARGGPLDMALRNRDGNVQIVANGFRQALLDAASTAGQGTQDALNDLRNARYAWKVVQTVRPAIDQTAQGSEAMSPLRLAQLIRSNFDMSQTGPGANMQDLARLIQATKPLPSSGTAERAAWQRWMGLGGIEAGPAGALWALGQPVLAAKTAAATAVPIGAAMLGGRALRFGPGLGIGPVQAIQSVVNPLLPRVLGPQIGNALIGNRLQGGQ
jgi:hypothetical protein